MIELHISVSYLAFFYVTIGTLVSNIYLDIVLLCCLLKQKKKLEKLLERLYNVNHKGRVMLSTHELITSR